MNHQAVLEVANVSDTGLRREGNEDSSASDVNLGLLVIADGMGGYRSGEVASAIAVAKVVTVVNSKLKLIHDRRAGAVARSVRAEVMESAVQEANAAVHDTAQSEIHCRGMGTTIIAALIHENRITVAHVGDSRLYRFRDASLEQMTTDHSLVQALIDRGVYTPEEALTHTPRNLVTRALGVERSVEVDILEDDVRPNDIYLLCTDGLNEMVNDENIHLTLNKYSANLEMAANQLIKQANDAGGKDNISVILARPKGVGGKSEGWASKIRGLFG
jgi:protein phosphatase